jgi:hypothetical protein
LGEGQLIESVTWTGATGKGALSLATPIERVSEELPLRLVAIHPCGPQAL